MKVLLLGEYSALHKNLKDGLLELGHQVTVAASGDGFKKISSDISFNAKFFSGDLGELERIIRPLFNLKLLRGFDVVQIINPFIFYHRRLPHRACYANLLLDAVFKGSEKKFILAAGDDAYFWRHGRKRLKYGPFDDFLKYDFKSDRFFMEDEEAFSFNSRIVSRSNGLIPVMYEYEVSYLDHEKRLPTIPLPINTEKIKFYENKVNRKLIVFHGLNRYGFKGTRHVEKAFSELRKKYPNDLELIIDGKMPLHKYLEVMSRSNVVIDQLYSHSLGMNGIQALALGKVVLGGAEPESLQCLGVDSSPVINLMPCAESIVAEIEKLISDKDKINEMGWRSRQFVEKNHGHISIAERYVETWRKN